jgi:ketosteroid isomerase-like protein
MLRGRIVLFTSSVFVMFALATGGQEPVKPPLTPRIITATRQVNLFTDLETQLLRAIQTKDQTGLSKLLMDDCLIEMPDADPLAGEDWIKSVMDKNYILKAFQVRQMSVSDLGDSAAVKFDRVQQATANGKPDSGEFFVVDLWKKDGGSWKLASRYVARVSSVPWTPKTAPRPTGKQ